MSSTPFFTITMKQAIQYTKKANLYIDFMLNLSPKDYGLFNSANIVERKFALNKEIFSELYEEEGVIKLADYVGIEDVDDIPAGSVTPLYDHFEDSNILYPHEPTKLHYHYMVTQYFDTEDELQEYVVEQQVWAMFMISALHLLAEQDG
ncbi:unnamed protein product [Rhizoctonia solani]|uniref:Uncharacterized protein n=1 Tax=Rhizoctonia solani TaxID=456999 RepID=A0A8H3BFX2_9AGAM|nr:unnamed protein product [Rhizoctonia solani]